MTSFMHSIDHSSYEIGSIQLTLRRDIAFRRQSFGENNCYVLEDSTRSQFFRIGPAEYTFLSLLDGHTSIADAVAETATRQGKHALTEAQAAALCSWLIQNALASTSQSQTSSRLIESATDVAGIRRREWLNPIMLKIPIGNPDSAIRKIYPAVSWLLGGFGFAIWLITTIVGAYFLSVDWERFSNSSQGVLAADNWLWLGITWLFLKLAHELAHGLVCRRHGGETREAGLLLLLFVPLPYVDVTSSWRFGSRWQRMYVAAAGIYAELFLAAMAAIAWANSSSELVQHHAFNILVTAGFVTLLFNINPLMRFDGYYILSDFLELPNLATHGHQDLLNLCRRWLLGIQSNRIQWPEGRSLLIRFYGVAACAWRIMICVTLTLAAELLYHGAGIILAFPAVVLWVVVPASRFMKYLIAGDPVNPPHRMRFACLLSVMILGGSCVWNYVTWVDRLRFPAIVDYEPVRSVRVGTSGFVRKVLIKPGDVVVAGQPLFELENAELAAQICELELAIEKSRLEATQFHRQGKIAALQVENENETALSARLTELISQRHELIVTAPTTGTIISRDLHDWMNRWISPGTELCALGDESERSLHFVVAQSEIDAMKSVQDQPVNVHIWGTGSSDVVGYIQKLDPRGTTALRYPALAVSAGGPLPIKVGGRSGSGQESLDNQEWELLEPFFTGCVKLKQSDLAPLGTGQTGYVEFVTSRGSVGSVIIASVKNLLSEHRLRR